MGRRANGWSLFKPKAGRYRVRFTFKGRRHDVSTGETNLRSAEVAAARIFAGVVNGNPAQQRTRTPSVMPLRCLFAKWLASLVLHHSTVAQYEMYVRAHFLPWFSSLDAINKVNAIAYTRARLERALRKTVLKELSALRGFLGWCLDHEFIVDERHIPSPRRNAHGTRQQVRQTIRLTANEVTLILHHLPEQTRNRGRPKAFYSLMWETALRRGTLRRLLTTDLNLLRAQLKVRESIDKNRYERTLPLSPNAVDVLRDLISEPGLIFGKHDYRHVLRKAAVQAGLSEDRAARVSDHDFRHARATWWLERSKGIAGVAFLLGHINVTTTAKYVTPNASAAEAVLRDVGVLAKVA